MISWKQDALLATVLLVLSGLFYFTSLGYPEDVALFPSHLAPLLAFLSAWLLVSALRRRAEEAPAFDLGRFKNVALLVVLMLAYTQAMPYIGFIAASILLVGVFFLTMNYPNRLVGLAVAVGSALLVYVLFCVILEVPLPAGSLFES